VIWSRTDWGLFIGGLGLSLIGALLVWSATRHQSGSQYLARHLLNTGIGMALAAALTLVDFRGLRAYAPWLYLVSVAGLVLVMTPVGSTINGSHSWIRLPGGFSVQPSEFAKVALCVGLAVILAERGERGQPPAHRDVALAWVVAGIPIGLVLLQPDLGSAVVLAALALGVIAVSGAPKRWVVAVMAVVLIGIAVAWTTPVLSQYQRDRLTTFANSSADPQGIGYQSHQVSIAIGSGGWQGQGLFQGRQTQGGFIPYQQTDFVFSVAGEELGFVGSVGLLLILGFLIVRTLMIAVRAKDVFSRLVALGVACWFTVQIFENVGMNLGIMPVTGLPLPFVSYGGSSMFACWLALGLVNNAHLSGLYEQRKR
jgi:rod shape determining protein RodA